MMIVLEGNDSESLHVRLQVAQDQLEALQAENAQLRAENDRLRAGSRPDPASAQLPAAPSHPRGPGELPYADRDSPAPQKIALFRTLFAGRSDIYATRWVSTAGCRAPESSSCRTWPICEAGRWTGPVGGGGWSGCGIATTAVVATGQSPSPTQPAARGKNDRLILMY
jgi:hypothetical protein